MNTNNPARFCPRCDHEMELDNAWDAWICYNCGYGLDDNDEGNEADHSEVYHSEEEHE